jgi:hypothetical protein
VFLVFFVVIVVVVATATAVFAHRQAAFFSAGSTFT